MAQSKDETAVAKEAEKLRLAMISGDSSELSGCISAQLSYGHSGGKVETAQEFIGNIRSGHSDFVTIDISGQTVLVKGSTAIVRHRLHATTNDGGKPGEVTLDVLQVWVKEKKEWKMLARQAVKAK
ncbi:MAG: nuclear transport factor 2 family protein [Edaphocola sp.]